MGEFLEIAKVMVQPTMKLLEMCGNAIGTVYEPRHIRKIADAEAYKIKQLSAAITESDSLPIAYENGNISMSTVNFEDFVKRAEFRANYQILREQNNIESVVGKAYQELIDAPAVPRDPVDEDWTTRFFNIVKEINTEEMQHLWSKILAGEIKNSGSFSMRTLEKIRNITREEAQAFQKVCNCVLFCGKSAIIPQADSLWKLQNVTYDELILLSEAGLLNLDRVIFSLDFPQDVTMIINITTSNYLLRLTGKTEKPTRITYNVYKLTKAGTELYSILQSTASEEYMRAVAKDIGTFISNKADIYLHRIASCTGDEISYENDPIFAQERPLTKEKGGFLCPTSNFYSLSRGLHPLRMWPLRR